MLQPVWDKGCHLHAAAVLPLQLACEHPGKHCCGEGTRPSAIPCGGSAQTYVGTYTWRVPFSGQKYPLVTQNPHIYSNTKIYLPASKAVRTVPHQQLYFDLAGMLMILTRRPRLATTGLQTN
jgi:hypothetical protein